MQMAYLANTPPKRGGSLMLLPLHAVTNPLSLFSPLYPSPSPSDLVLYCASPGQSNCGQHQLSKTCKTFLLNFSVRMRLSFAHYNLHGIIDAAGLRSRYGRCLTGSTRRSLTSSRVLRR